MALRILAVGPGATIQDGGRFGLLRFGVTPAGPMDWVAMRSANLALGNEPMRQPWNSLAGAWP